MERSSLQGIDHAIRIMAGLRKTTVCFYDVMVNSHPHQGEGMQEGKTKINQRSGRTL